MHLGYRPHDAENINVRELAYDSRGFTGAQLGSLVNTAAGLAGRQGRDMITQADLKKVCLSDQGPTVRLLSGSLEQHCQNEVLPAVISTSLAAVQRDCKQH